VPDAPISLANDPTVTTDTVIRFTWTPGVSDGGSSVIDYSVYYDQGTDNYIEIESNSVDEFYVTT
jgi:hypothetical protein